MGLEVVAMGEAALALRNPVDMCCYNAGADQEPSRAIGTNSVVSICKIKLIGNQLGCMIYIASCFSLNKR